jgi:drug/metabolite transporter (DMT)-like permease
MPKPHSIDSFAVAAMIVLCGSWGFQQVAVKLALYEVPPIAQAAMRSAGATVLVAAWAFVMRRDLRVDDGTFWPGLICGVIFAAEFMFLFLGIRLTDASRVVMFLYTAPFVVAVGAPFLPVPEALTIDRWIGIAIAFAGLVILLGPNLSVSGATLLGDLFALAAGILWGVTTLIIKGSTLRTAEPAKVLLYQLAVSAFFLVAASAVAGERFGVPQRWETWASVLYQVIWVTTVTYLVWFALVRRYPPARLSVLSFLSPVFGVMFGHWLLGEPLTGSLILALVLVALGIVLVNRPTKAS